MYTVKLLRTPNVPEKLLQEVIEILNEPKGRAIKFESEAIPLSTSHLSRSWNGGYSWESLLSLPRAYRVEKKLVCNEFLMLLTDEPNDRNWFCISDETEENNTFIHTADWDNYFSLETKYALAYLVGSQVLNRLTYKTQYAHIEAMHENSISCLNDKCVKKVDIGKKMRSADICITCTENIKAARVNPVVCFQVFNLFEGIRRKLILRNSYRYKSSVHVTSDGTIILPEFGDVEVNLTPQRKAFYFLYLLQPKGFRPQQLETKVKEYAALYQRITGATTDNAYKKAKKALSGKNPEQISSKIKAAFIEAIGDEEMALKYVIKGEREEAKRIDFDRNKVKYEFINPLASKKDGVNKLIVKADVT